MQKEGSKADLQMFETYIELLIVTFFEAVSQPKTGTLIALL
jgi:hypothetical protein